MVVVSTLLLLYALTATSFVRAFFFLSLQAYCCMCWFAHQLEQQKPSMEQQKPSKKQSSPPPSANQLPKYWIRRNNGRGKAFGPWTPTNRAEKTNKTKANKTKDNSRHCRLCPRHYSRLRNGETKKPPREWAKDQAFEVYERFALQRQYRLTLENRRAKHPEAVEVGVEMSQVAQVAHQFAAPCPPLTDNYVSTTRSKPRNRPTHKGTAGGPPTTPATTSTAAAAAAAATAAAAIMTPAAPSSSAANEAPARGGGAAASGPSSSSSALRLPPSLHTTWSAPSASSLPSSSSTPSLPTFSPCSTASTSDAHTTLTVSTARGSPPAVHTTSSATSDNTWYYVNGAGAGAAGAAGVGAGHGATTARAGAVSEVAACMTRAVLAAWGNSRDPDTVTKGRRDVEGLNQRLLETMVAFYKARQLRACSGGGAQVLAHPTPPPPRVPLLLQPRPQDARVRVDGVQVWGDGVSSLGHLAFSPPSSPSSPPLPPHPHHAPSSFTVETTPAYEAPHDIVDLRNRTFQLDPHRLVTLFSSLLHLAARPFHRIPPSGTLVLVAWEVACLAIMQAVLGKHRLRNNATGPVIASVADYSAGGYRDRSETFVPQPPFFLRYVSELRQRMPEPVGCKLILIDVNELSTPLDVHKVLHDVYHLYVASPFPRCCEAPFFVFAAPVSRDLDFFRS